MGYNVSVNTFPLRVLRINETLYDGEAVSLTAPGSAGELTILAKHETMLSSLQAGTLVIRKEDNQNQEITLDHGFLEATSDQVTVLL